MTKINETIKTVVIFEKNIIKPYLFFWHGRQIKIDKINLVHTSKNGSSVFYHFSVSSGGNFYRLRFDVNKLSWILEEIDDTSY